MDENVITLVMHEKRWSRFSLHSLMPGKLAVSSRLPSPLVNILIGCVAAKDLLCCSSRRSSRGGMGGGGGNPRKLERIGEVVSLSAAFN